VGVDTIRSYTTQSDQSDRIRHPIITNTIGDSTCIKDMQAAEQTKERTNELTATAAAVLAFLRPFLPPVLLLLPPLLLLLVPAGLATLALGRFAALGGGRVTFSAVADADVDAAPPRLLPDRSVISLMLCALLLRSGCKAWNGASPRRVERRGEPAAPIPSASQPQRTVCNLHRRC